LNGFSWPLPLTRACCSASAVCPWCRSRPSCTPSRGSRAASKSGELGDDRAGRERADHGLGATAYEPRTDAHRKEQQRFAHELAERLEQGAHSNAYGSLVVFAGNPFLGMLRDALGEATKRLLKTSLPVDLSHVGEAELERRVREELAAVQA